MLSDKSSGFVQLFRHPHPPRRVDSAACPPIASVPECTASSATLQPSREADTKAAVTAPVVPVEYVKESTARSGTGVAAKAKRSSSEKSTRGSGGFADGGFIQAVRSPAAKLGNNEGGGSVVKDTGKGGGASIFGVAFDDYIGEDGVRALPGTIDRAEAEIVGRESRLQDGGHSDGNAGRIRDMPTGLQEDRRWDGLLYPLWGLFCGAFNLLSLRCLQWISRRPCRPGASFVGNSLCLPFRQRCDRAAHQPRADSSPLPPRNLVL